MTVINGYDSAKQKPGERIEVTNFCPLDTMDSKYWSAATLEIITAAKSTPIIQHHSKMRGYEDFLRQLAAHDAIMPDCLKHLKAIYHFIAPEKKIELDARLNNQGYLEERTLEIQSKTHPEIVDIFDRLIQTA